MTHKLPPQALDRDLVLDFFWKFSVFECALKREGFLRTGRNDPAEPDWDRFGHEVHGRFAHVSALGFGEAVENLKRFSSRRQVVCNGRLGWDTGDSDEAYVLRLLRTTRNNLFHGGKYPDGPVEEISRDRDILKASLVIVVGALDPCGREEVDRCSGIATGFSGPRKVKLIRRKSIGHLCMGWLHEIITLTDDVTGIES